MTPEQISALEWAATALLGSDAPQMEVLCDLLEQSKHSYLERENNPRVLDFMKKWGITIPLREFSQWRWLTVEHQKIGEIRGLPQSRGKIVMTNGVMCWIERTVMFPFHGHYESFMPDEKQPMAVGFRSSVRARIHKNIWDNWNGYVKGKHVIEFGTNEAAAKEWLRGQTVKVKKEVVPEKKNPLEKLFEELEIVV